MEIPECRVLIGDSLTVLKTLPDSSVNCCVTSPPYFGLRDYGHAGQMGLEKTPQEYVDAMVALFREVRRVIRDDGTLWLNLGDSYCSAGGVHEGRADNQPGVGAGQRQWREGSARADGDVRSDGKSRRNRNGVSVAVLKPKNLIGIPWRVARALQEPYYTGTIRSEGDRIWLAAMIDGEGCMFLHRRKAGQSNGQGYTRKADSYGAGLEVANTSREIVERCLAITGRGSICRQEKARKQPLYRWNLRSNECREVIREIYPHLVGKQHQARLLLGCPSSGLKAEAAHAGLIALHNGQHCEIDFPAPESMFEPGWYLRQDIIWSKSNPMPESVRDRCTKAHEYIFMLTKSARYFYDADAIKNPPSPDLLKQVAEGYNGSSTKEFANGGAQDASETKARIIKNARKKIDKQRGHSRRHAGFNERWDAMTREEQQMLGSNKRSVWSVATRPYRGAHFATFPPELIRPCIKAGCPAGGVVLDPFGGSGTTGQVSMEEGRRSILIELNPAYGELISERLRKTAESMQPKPEKKRRAEYTEQKPKTRGDPNQIMFDGLDRTCDFPLTPSRDCAEVGA